MSSGLMSAVVVSAGGFLLDLQKLWRTTTGHVALRGSAERTHRSDPAQPLLVRRVSGGKGVLHDRTHSRNTVFSDRFEGLAQSWLYLRSIGCLALFPVLDHTLTQRHA
jgi:hypothetical protein